MFPSWCSGKESACQCRRCGFDPWVRKVPWNRKWQPTPVFLPGKFHGQRIWQAIVLGIAQSWTWLSTHEHFSTCAFINVNLLYSRSLPRNGIEEFYVSVCSAWVDSSKSFYKVFKYTYCQNGLPNWLSDKETCLPVQETQEKSVWSLS